MKTNLQVNSRVAWVLVILNLILLGYFAVMYYRGENVSGSFKGAQSALTFTVWVILVSDIFMLKLKDRWFWVIGVTVLLPVAAPVYLWRRPGMVQERMN